jgi:glycosyltransferase involved in cell wall biosynthesis
MAVVVTRIRGNVDLVEDGVNGFLFDPGDVNALKSLLEKVLDEKLRCQIGENAREKVEQYSWRKTTEKYRELLLQR